MVLDSRLALAACALMMAIFVACGDGVDRDPAPSEEVSASAGAAGQMNTGGTAAGIGGAHERDEGGTAGADDDSDLCDFEYRQGHGDLFVGLTEEGDLKIFLRTDDALLNPEGVCLFVPEERRELVEQLRGRPPGEAWEPVGVPEGGVFWHLPAEPVAGVPWFGIASEGVHAGVLQGDEMVLTLVETHLPEEAAFSSYETNTVGEPNFLFSTSSDISAMTFPVEGHAHMSWTFSHTGEYLLTFTAEGTSAASGEVLVSEPATFRFLVQDW